MTAIPPNEVTQRDLEEWYRLQDDLRKTKAAEILLRQKIFKHYFPTPDEGTNTFGLADGYALKGGHVINRDIDQAALTALAEQFQKAKIVVADLVKWKPELKVGEYRKLTKEQQQLFDQALIVKPGSPTLEIVLPKKASSK